MRVLIVRVGAMGDVLHALPAVAALRQQRPDWVIDWVVDPRWAPLLVNAEGRAPVIRHVHVAKTQIWKSAPLSKATLRSVLALRDALRLDRYDVTVDMQGTLRSAVIGRMAGAQTLAGYRDPREPLAGWLYSRRIARRGAHVVEQGVALLGEATGLELTPAEVELPREEWAETWAEELVGEWRTCVLAAGGGWAGKRWPVERFGELARELRKAGFRVLVSAPREDDATAAAVVAASGGTAEKVVCGVAGLAALVRRAALVVGGDTGPVHLAATLGVPVVAIFGPTDPARNGPWGAGRRWTIRHADSVTSYRRSGKADAGLLRVDVATVMAAVRAVTG